MLADIAAARAQGAPLQEACSIVGIGLRTYRRWKAGGEDARGQAERDPPVHKLSTAEREAIVTVCNEPRFASLPPSQIVPRLADEGCYLGSESSFYRILHEQGLQHHRGRSREPQRREPPTHAATGPNQVWCWDVSYLPSGIRGLYFYLYLVLDLFSRKVVAWEVHGRECGEHGAALIRRAVLMAGRGNTPLILHADNGAPMKSATLQETLRQLGIAPSHSRPRVSNDNAFVESAFRTCKYRPEYPTSGFETIDAARQWVWRFVQWYNEEHRHSGLNFVTPMQRHTGQAPAIMEQRVAVYEAARQRNPRRWSRGIRDWSLPTSVRLNPIKEAESEMAQAA